MPTMIPHKDAMIGMALQAAKGSPAAGPTVLFPLSEGGEGVNQKNNFATFQYADGRFTGPTHYWTKGVWAEGNLRFPIIPGMLVNSGGSGGMTPVTPAGNMSDVGAWCFARDPLLGEGYYATIFRKLGHVNEYYPDCKVMSGKISVNGGDMAMLDLTIAGCGARQHWTPADPATFGSLRALPYIFAHAAITIDTLADNLTGDHSLEFDNMVSAPGDMLTLWGSAYPYSLPNAELAKWTGSFKRKFGDATLYNKFVMGIPAAYTLTLSNAVATAVIMFPRIIYTEDPLKIPATGFIEEDSITFEALGEISAAGVATYPFSVAETLA